MNTYSDSGSQSADEERDQQYAYRRASPRPSQGQPQAIQVQGLLPSLQIQPSYQTPYYSPTSAMGVVREGQGHLREEAYQAQYAREAAQQGGGQGQGEGREASLYPPPRTWEEAQRVAASGHYDYGRRSSEAGYPAGYERQAAPSPAIPVHRPASADGYFYGTGAPPPQPQTHQQQQDQQRIDGEREQMYYYSGGYHAPYHPANYTYNGVGQPNAGPSSHPHPSSGHHIAPSPYPSTVSRSTSVSDVTGPPAAYERESANTEERQFKCDECPHAFHRNHDLKRHKRIHLEVKPFPCHWCDKRFTRKDALKRHLLVKQHPPAPSDPSLPPLPVKKPTKAALNAKARRAASEAAAANFQSSPGRSSSGTPEPSSTSTPDLRSSMNQYEAAPFNSIAPEHDRSLSHNSTATTESQNSLSSHPSSMMSNGAPGRPFASEYPDRDSKDELEKYNSFQPNYPPTFAPFA
jgi:hypothetical protein